MSTPPATLHDLYPGLPVDAAVSPPVAHDVLVDLATQFTDLIISAIPSGTIAPADYAGRTESALREAATATVFSEALSLAVESLAPGQRGPLSADQQSTAVALGGALSSQDVFAQWAELVGRDAIYITAVTLVARRSRRVAKTAAKQQSDVTPAEVMF